MSDKLEILLNIVSHYDDQKQQLNENLKKFENDLKNLGTKDKAEVVNIGPGADWEVILYIIGSLYFLGDPINKNLEAWIKLAKKFINFLNKAKRNVRFIDSNGATLIGINEILKIEIDIKSLELTNSIELSNNPIKKYFLDNRPKERIDSKPYRLFIKTFLVNNEFFYTFGIKSDGKIAFINKFSDQWDEFDKYSEIEIKT